MIGEKIKKLRESKGLSLSECAERAGVAKSYLSTIERGLRSNPSIQFIEKVADVLNVTVTSLINDETSLEETLAKANEDMDQDWLELVKEAMDSGIEKREFKEFLEYQKWRKGQS
jgi:XRE family transcriptional regulator, master regulator for biofilm formation